MAHCSDLIVRNRSASSGPLFFSASSGCRFLRPLRLKAFFFACAGFKKPVTAEIAKNKAEITENGKYHDLLSCEAEILVLAVVRN